MTIAKELANFGVPSEGERYGFAQAVKIGKHRFRFETGESIHTENSYKYSADDFRALAAGRTTILISHRFPNFRRRSCSGTTRCCLFPNYYPGKEVPYAAAY